MTDNKKDNKKGNAKSNRGKSSKRNVAPLFSLSTSDQIIRLLVIILVGIVPLIIFCKVQTFVSPKLYATLTLPTVQVTDYFTYYKSIALSLIAGLIVAAFLAKALGDKGDIKASSLDIPILAFVLSLSLSLIFADYKSIALWGGYTRNFGVAAYLACAFILFILIKSRMDGAWIKKWFGYALCPVVIVNAMMMTLAFFGMEMSQHQWFVSLITGGRPELLAEGTIIAETLTHKNYISGLGGILFAFFAGKAVTEEGRWWELALNILMVALSAVMVYISASLSGIVTMALTAVLLVIPALDGKRKGLLKLLGVAGAVAVLWVVLIVKNPSFMNEWMTQDKGLILASVVIGLILAAVYAVVKNRRRLSRSVMLTGGGILLIICIAGSFIAVPKVYNAVHQEMERISTGNMLERLEKDEFYFPEPQFTWGTGRIYIWKEAFKLIAERPLFGYGMDSLSFNLNQGDPAKVPAMDSASVIIDKPHNVYVNMLFGAGIVTFLAFGSIVFLVLKHAFRTAFVAEGREKTLIWPLILGIMAYLYQGMFNDPVQGVDGIFWVMMGLAYNLAVKRSEKKAD